MPHFEKPSETTPNLSDQPAAAPPLSTARSTPPLSPTEERVYALLIQRLTERQVAEQLGRSHNTVHVHVRNIYRKLAIRSRQELFDLHQQSVEAQTQPQPSYIGQLARARNPSSTPGNNAA